ncbi:amidohydrolase family protein [Sphingobium sp. DEHP117]|uniref:amidohydrolase family protein n=1 Tax=Sphingobium sp. DEHP117 TaxID=2993436 RepID=UPI0027D74F31|nr:amidohydrolase family protein [Sphingobium sp. DEHP117]MDQ4420366.1 amidohydrolase family protein [Sphingobium sp. DEHP117]
MTNYICIDADAHITEPSDTWTSRVAARFKDRVPQVRTDPANGAATWYMGDSKLATVGLTAMAGFAGELPAFPLNYEDAITSSYDSAERLKFMDEAGIWAQVLYGNVGGFGAQQFLTGDDRDLANECVRAYNDFLVDWTSVDPRRFVKSVAVPFWDVDETVKEIKRCVDLGFRGITFTGAPHEFGFPFIGDRYWDPLWEIAVEADLPINFHIGSGDLSSLNFEERCKVDGFASAWARGSADCFLMNAFQLNDLLFSGVLARHPKIKFVSVESGIGWIPFVLEAADHQFAVNDVAKNRPEFTMRPSDYFRQNVYACYWFEKDAPGQVIDTIGENNILFETDFPHPTCLYDNVAEAIDTALGSFDPVRKRKILFENAADLYKIEMPADLVTA